MKVMNYNTLFAGIDGMDSRRWNLQIQTIRSQDPDVLLMQKAKGFDIYGCRILFAVETQLQMRGLLARARDTGQNTALFFKPPINLLITTPSLQNLRHRGLYEYPIRTC